MSSRDDLVKVVLANDGGTCHGFGKMHCFNDPAAKWDGRRCNECKDWAERILRSVEDPIRADDRELGSALNAALLRDLRADLRAKVDALRLETWDAYRSLDYAGADVVKRALATRAQALQDVLNLIDGSSDGSR